MHPYFRALTSGAGRWLQVWREGELVTELDLAKVAVSGDSQDDVVLEDGDALFVPANMHPVIVRGGVSRPGTYEFADGDTVLDLLAQAGGYRSMMMLDKVAVERAASPGSVNPTEVVLNLRDPSFDPQSFAFQSGDILRVPEVKQQVYVLGAVVMPQAVDYHEGWNALDYMAATGGPIAATDAQGIRIISLPLDANQSELRFDFKSLLLGGPVETAPIQPGDMIYVPWKNQPFYGAGLTGAIAGFIAQTIGLLRLMGGD
jgi:protein involved in polysaccharide export with SLBB domain